MPDRWICSPDDDQTSYTHPHLVIVRIVMAIANPRHAPVRRPREQALGGLEVIVQLVVELFQELVANGDDTWRWRTRPA